VTGYVVGRRVPSTRMCPTGMALPRVIARILTALAAVLFVVIPLTASAHTDLDFTEPSDGAEVGEPVADVTVGFTQAVTLIGPGFEVLDPQGNVLTPPVVSDDDQVFRLRLEPPLAGGEAAVRYEVRAQDGHTITGGFSFTISADAPPSTVAVTTTEPGTTEPGTTEPGTTEPGTTEPGTTEPGTTEPGTTAAPVSAEAPAVTAVSDGPPSDDDGTDDEGIASEVYLAIAGAVVIGVAAFAVIRARASTAGRP
jgi:copper transport protein